MSLWIRGYITVIVVLKFAYLLEWCFSSINREPSLSGDMYIS